MKLHLSIAAATTLVALALAPVSARASCQNICVRAYNACLASGIPQAECQAELSQCFEDCTGGVACNANREAKDEPDADGSDRQAEAAKAKA